MKFLKNIWWNKKNRSMYSSTAACKSTKHRAKLFFFLPSQFQSDWLWYRTTAKECFCFGSIVYPRQWGSKWRGCGDCWIGMRLRGRRAAGWQQDQTHRGQSSLKRPGWGVGAAGPQGSRDTLGGKSACLCDWMYVHVWSKAHAYLESMHIIMWVCVSGSVCHMDSYTPRLEKERGGNIPSHQCTPAVLQPNNNSAQICESTQCEEEYEGCLQSHRSANHLGRWTVKLYHQFIDQENKIAKGICYCS